MICGRVIRGKQLRTDEVKEKEEGIGSVIVDNDPSTRFNGCRWLDNPR